MSIVFLDSEFNGHGGELISLGMVSSRGDEFYEVVNIPKKRHIHPWVEANVVPKLLQPAIGRGAVRSRAFKWLELQGAPLIIADWPADFIHLLDLMFAEHDPSMRFNFNPRMELIDTPTFPPEWHHLQHNALSDAWTLRDWYMPAFEKSNLIYQRPLLTEVLSGKFDTDND